MLHQAGTMLEQVIADPKNAIPDAVLNRTGCFVVFPAAREIDRPVIGFVSCRNHSGAWTSPAVATFSKSGGEQVRGELLLFILSQRARMALLGGHLQLGEKLLAAKGPLQIARPTLDPVELGTDVFAYVHSDDSLQGIKVGKGSIAVDESATRALYGHALDVRALLDKSTMSSTVSSFLVLDISSFFNTITPVGIIVHHSVLIPSNDLADAEQALDKFHYGRGFEIACFGKIYHIAYHYLVFPSGEVRAGRPERCEGAHARGYNSYLGIVLVGDFSSADNPHGRKGPVQPTRAQMDSLIRLCRSLRDKYNIPLQHIMPHSQVARTQCPGDRVQFGHLLAALEQPSRSGS